MQDFKQELVRDTGTGSLSLSNAKGGHRDRFLVPFQEGGGTQGQVPCPFPRSVV
jgi:hypothetical protein